MRKNDIKNLFKRNSGTALFLTVLILTSILTVVLSAAGLVMSGVKIGRSQANSLTAYFVAEVGAERALWAIRKGDYNFLECADSGECLDFSDEIVVCGDCHNTNVVLPDSSIYNVYYASSSPDIYFTSIGIFRGIRRSVEVNFAH